MTLRNYVCLCVLDLVLGAATTALAAGRDKVPAGLKASDWNSIRAEYERNRHAAHRVGSGYLAHNPGQQWMTRFDERGFVVEPNSGGWQWGLALESYGVVDHERTIKGPAAVATQKERVSYTWDNRLEEWFVNDQRGLEHGFTLAERPTGDAGQLVFHLAVRGGLHPKVHGEGSGVAFLDSEGNSRLQYGGLKVWDAVGKRLPARMSASGDRIRLEVDDRGAHYPITIDPIAQQAALTASHIAFSAEFGHSVAVSGDTVVVGARRENGSSTGVNGDQTDIGAIWSGAAYVFVRNGSAWSQQAYLKASNTGQEDEFGSSVAISGDTVVVGANLEDSAATGVGGTQTDNSASNSGAVYVFVRSGSTWSQQAYLKASNTDVDDEFGAAVAVSGNTVLVGARYEASNATGAGGNQADNSAILAGAAYVFVRNGSTWSQQTYLKPSNTVAGVNFGNSVAISGDTLVVGSHQENSNATGVNGDQTNLNAVYSGAAYVFVRNGSTWSQQAYLKASNTASIDYFGTSVSISGNTVIVGAIGEDSGATGANGNQADNSVSDSGAAYVFVRTGSVWTQQAYLKASNPGATDYFGYAVAISGDIAAIGAIYEDSSATGVNGDESKNDRRDAGATYVFARTASMWTQQAYLKAPTPRFDNRFGRSVAVSGGTVIAGVLSDETGTGVTYVFTEFATPCGTERSMTAGQWTMFSLPCAADAPSTVSSVLSGVSGNYDSDWVVYGRNEATDAYVKLGLNDPVSQGNGYWFKSASAANFFVSGTTTPVTNPSGCTSASGCFEITLTKPSTAGGLQNLAGNPFAYNVDWPAVRVVANGGNAVAPSIAETNGDVSKTFWIWNGSSYDSFDDVTPGMIGQLQSTYGMWVKVLDQTLTTIKLLVPSKEDTEAQAGVVKKGALQTTEWYVRIVAEAAADTLKDRGNVLGQLKDSKPGFDSHDLPELAPGFTPYLTVVFPRPNWGAKKGDYASDFHKLKTGADSWSFVVRTDNPARRVRLSWEVSGKAPANMSLKDLKTGKVTQRKAGGYTFVMGAKERSFTWSVR